MFRQLSKTISYPLIVLIALNVFPLFFISQLAFDNAPEVYLPENQPAVILEKQLRENFPEDKIILVLFHGNNLFSDQFLASLDTACRQIEKNEQIDRVLSVTGIEHISGIDDGFEISLLLGKERQSEIIDEQKRYQYARQDRFANKTLIGHTMEYMAIVIRPYRLDSTIERQSLF